MVDLGGKDQPTKEQQDLAAESAAVNMLKKLKIVLPKKITADETLRWFVTVTEVGVTTPVIYTFKGETPLQMLVSTNWDTPTGAKPLSVETVYKVTTHHHKHKRTQTHTHARTHTQESRWTRKNSAMFQNKIGEGDILMERNFLHNHVWAEKIVEEIRQFFENVDQEDLDITHQQMMLRLQKRLEELDEVTLTLTYHPYHLCPPLPATQIQANSFYCMIKPALKSFSPEKWGDLIPCQVMTSIVTALHSAHPFSPTHSLTHSLTQQRLYLNELKGLDLTQDTRATAAIDRALTSIFGVCACVHVCVCMWLRDEGRGRGHG